MPPAEKRLGQAAQVYCVQQSDVVVAALNNIVQTLEMATKGGTPFKQLAVFESLKKLMTNLDRVRGQLINLTLPPAS